MHQAREPGAHERGTSWRPPARQIWDPTPDLIPGLGHIDPSLDRIWGSTPDPGISTGDRPWDLLDSGTVTPESKLDLGWVIPLPRPQRSGTCFAGPYTGPRSAEPALSAGVKAPATGRQSRPGHSPWLSKPGAGLTNQRATDLAQSWPLEDPGLTAFGRPSQICFTAGCYQL